MTKKIYEIKLKIAHKLWLRSAQLLDPIRIAEQPQQQQQQLKNEYNNNMASWIRYLITNGNKLISNNWNEPHYWACQDQESSLKINPCIMNTIMMIMVMVIIMLISINWATATTTTAHDLDFNFDLSSWLVVVCLKCCCWLWVNNNRCNATCCYFFAKLFSTEMGNKRNECGAATRAPQFHEWKQIFTLINFSKSMGVFRHVRGHWAHRTLSIYCRYTIIMLIMLTVVLYIDSNNNIIMIMILII